MNVLFMSLLDFDSLNERNIYTDLLRQFVIKGHDVTVISPYEKRTDKKERLIREQNSIIVKIEIGNIQKVNFVEKGISTMLLEYQLICGIRKYLSQKKFDLILYTTPPITFQKAVSYVKRRDDAVTYLLLKDIFPQNAVDLGILTKKGWTGLIHRYFRNKERSLYRISDYIGCMSQANVDYILQHNPEVRVRNDREKVKNGKAIVEICPNCIEPVDISLSREEREEIRKKYDIPLDKIVFIYGGNLGKPQGIEFMLKCLHSQRENDKVFFLIVGNGTEYRRVEQYVEKYESNNIALHQWIPKEEYDKVVAACDIGMLFLDHRFTIPNFPSRLLSYMSAKLPVLAVTDTATDIGEVIVENGFGWWCESDDANLFSERINEILEVHLNGMKGHEVQYLGPLAYIRENARQYLIKNYSDQRGYEIIMTHVQKNNQSMDN